MFIDIIGFIFGVIYVVMVSLGKKEGWLFNIVYSSILSVVSFKYKLWANFILGMYFVFSATTAYVKWGKETKNFNPSFETKRNNLKFFLLFLGVSILWSLLLKFVLNGRLPILDAMSFAGNVVALLLAIRGKIENYYYFLTANTINLFLMSVSGSYFLAFSFFIFIIFNMVGLFNWKKIYKTSFNK
ncbi:MAG: nicotinamide riboside transporter PnuC [Rickettsiales bacterium]|jgi:nicotinamide mononucleotide transporter|nr:nicotinamide riboside transporter PnuC [Rickettsiales bacterium]